MYITQGLKRAVQVGGKGVATVDGDRKRTWLEVSRRVAKLAGGLGGLGLSRGGRVAVLAHNSDRYLEAFFAVAWAGGVLVPLNIRLPPAELADMLGDAGAEILIIDDALASRVPALTATVRTLNHYVLAGEGEIPVGAWGYEDLLAAADPIPDAERGGDAVAAILYTGGTTGRSKGVMLSHDNIVSNAMSLLAALYRGAPWTYLHTAPMFHVADFQFNTAVTLQAATHVFVPKFTPEVTLKAIADHRVTHLCLVPTMLTMLMNTLMNTAGIRDYDLSSLQRIHYGGSPMPPAVIAKAKTLLPHVALSQGYGQTETAPNISILLEDRHTLDGRLAGKIESAGQPVHLMEVTIVDSEDNGLPLGQVGEVTVRGPHVMAGYWKNPVETEVALRRGWMHTGDAGYIDEDGFLFIVDRVKDMIISGGENVYSAEVESVLYEHPAVAMCAVIGIPDALWGEAIHAVVVLKEGQSLSEEALIRYCRNNIAAYKCPRSVDIRREPLPMTGTGKILKQALRAPFWQDKSRRVN